MKLKEKIFSALTEATKKGETGKRDALRLLFSAIKNTEIEKQKKAEGLEDNEVIEVIARSVKQRKDSIEQYEKGGRHDLADKEKVEIAYFSEYLPEQLSPEAVEAAVREVIDGMGEVTAKDMGRVMGMAMQKLKGQADGNLVREIVQKVLSA